MKKHILVTVLAALMASPVYSDMYKHNLQVFTANTMEIPCKTAPKELFFGKAEEAEKFSKDEMKSIVNSGISSAGSHAGEWIRANGISGGDLLRGFGIGFIGDLLGTWTKNAIYAAMDDPEYILISECNNGKEYTRLITMVVSEEKLPLEKAKALAKADQEKMAKVVNR